MISRVYQLIVIVALICSTAESTLAQRKAKKLPVCQFIALNESASLTESSDTYVPIRFSLTNINEKDIVNVTVRFFREQGGILIKRIRKQKIVVRRGTNLEIVPSGIHIPAWTGYTQVKAEIKLRKRSCFVNSEIYR